MNKFKGMLAAVIGFACMFAMADAQVYTFTATLKTTVAVRGKVKAAMLTCLDESETLVYRKQGSVKLAGLIWGCDCDALSGVNGWNGETEDGCAFWNVTNKQLLDGNFAWVLLNRIDSTAKKAEGAWTYEAECYNLYGGGFGSVKVIGGADEEEIVLTSLAGNVAGWKCAPGYTRKTGKSEACTFCGSAKEADEETDIAVAWTLCDCGESTDYTAVSGTWNLKYNASATAKLRKEVSIFEAYKFPEYAKKGLVLLGK